MGFISQARADSVVVAVRSSRMSILNHIRLLEKEECSLVKPVLG